MGSEGSIGSIRSAGSGQSTEGTSGHSTGLLIENAKVWGRAFQCPQHHPPLLVPRAVFCCCRGTREARTLSMRQPHCCHTLVPRGAALTCCMCWDEPRGGAPGSLLTHL